MKDNSLPQTETDINDSSNLPLIESNYNKSENECILVLALSVTHHITIYSKHKNNVN